MRRRFLPFAVLLASAAVAVVPASAKSCTKGTCRAPVGVYDSKVLDVSIGGKGKFKNHVVLQQIYNSATFIKGSCKQSGVGTFETSVKPDPSEPEWHFKGKAPVIGKVTSYRQRAKTGSAGLTQNFDITIKIHMLTAKKATVAIAFHNLIVNSQPGVAGTSHCAASGKSTVKYSGPPSGS
jgi:hypothetical protein